MLKTFQRALLPSQSNLIRSASHGPVLSPDSFQFVLGSSSHPTLSRAVVECVQQVKSKLGPDRTPHLCQLFVTADSYASRNIRFGGAYVRECLSGSGDDAPVVIGGVVQSLLGSGSGGITGQGVSLMAASLPNVRLFPFHTTDTALPELESGSWRDLISGNASSSSGAIADRPRERTAGILLSEPHFTAVEELLGRLRGVLPQAPWLGGVLQHAAWGPGASLRGALFLNSETYDEGAVGCIMRGPLRFDQLCWQGCRPVGRIVEVTEAKGNIVTQLDDLPALEVFQKLWLDMDMSDRMLPLKLGLDASGSGSAFITRNLAGFNVTPEQSSLQVAVSEVAEGSLLQLHVEDAKWSQAGIRTCLQEYADHLPGALAQDPSQLGAWLYSCEETSHDEEAAMAKTMPDLPLQGARCRAQFGQWGADERATMLASSSNFGFLQHAATWDGICSVNEGQTWSMHSMSLDTKVMAAPGWEHCQGNTAPERKALATQYTTTDQRAFSCRKGLQKP
ncbi:g6093 [Coccomyxa viridis]|uniref:G6093 protein n=1 Tax=Coccomyxa viridis TaxID=1274662 RepID=A0ABP1FYH1_9CHLO